LTGRSERNLTTIAPRRDMTEQLKPDHVRPYLRVEPPKARE
jgi:hypothetical protein